MQTKYNLISVIVNCYNGEKFINRCIKSILDQSYQNFEIIFGTITRMIKHFKLLKNLMIKELSILNQKNLLNYMRQEI